MQSTLGGALGLAVSGGIVACSLRRQLANQSPGAYAATIFRHGTLAITRLPVTTQAQVAALLRTAISTSLIVGGMVMLAAFLLMLRMTTRLWRLPTSPVDAL